jgi:hypothetical protein
MSIYNFPAAATAAGGQVFIIPTSQTTGTVTTTGKDLSAYTGNALFIWQVTSSATGRSATAKLQHCDTATTGSYEDVTGGAFTAFTSGQTGLRELAMNVDGLKKYVRVSRTVAGGAVVNGAIVEGWKNY